MKQNPESESRATRGVKRTKVLEEAAKSLNHQGVSQTSLADIARRVGISRAALYYYFEDQQDLVFQSYRQSCELMSQRLAQAERDGGTSLTIVDAFVDGMLDEAETEFAALSEMAYLRPEQRAAILALYESILERVARILRQSHCRAGYHRPDFMDPARSPVADA